MTKVSCNPGPEATGRIHEKLKFYDFGKISDAKAQARSGGVLRTEV